MSTGGKKGEAPPEKKKPIPKVKPEGLSLWIRIVASIVLAFHVFVLFFYPLDKSRTSFTVHDIAQSPAIRWYPDILYLNHGHGFFGPDPGASFLVEYEVRDKDGEVIDKATGKFPDADRIWPRLRYHRYKMLADQLEAPGRADKEGRLKAYARQLIRQYDGESATVSEVMHEIVSHGDWLGDEAHGIAPKALDDKTLYRTLTTVTQTRADVEAADAPAPELEDDSAATAPEVLDIPLPSGVVQ